MKKQTAKLLDLFKDYRLALYTHGFAYFLEVMLLGNFDADYLKSIAGKIEEYSIQYRELYTAVYDQMENYSKSSVQSAVLKGLKNVSKATGEAIAIDLKRKPQTEGEYKADDYCILRRAGICRP